MPLALKIELWGPLANTVQLREKNRLGNKDGFYSHMGEGKLLQSSGELNYSILHSQQPACVTIMCSLQSVPPLNNW